MATSNGGTNGHGKKLSGVVLNITKFISGEQEIM